MIPDSSIPIIYGITNEPSEFGVQAYAIDGQTGDVIAQHFCSNEEFAKSDLGFLEPIKLIEESSDETHTTVTFGELRRQKYSERFPNGYKLEWVGFWETNPIIVDLREKRLKAEAKNVELL